MAQRMGVGALSIVCNICRTQFMAKCVVAGVALSQAALRPRPAPIAHEALAPLALPTLACPPARSCSQSRGQLQAHLDSKHPKNAFAEAFPTFTE